PMLLKNPVSAPMTATGRSCSESFPPLACQRAARAVAATPSEASQPSSPSPALSRARKPPAPPKNRRLPSASASSACGGSSETLGVNWQAQAARFSSACGGRALKCRATQSMDRPLHLQQDRRRGGGAAALEDAYGKLLAAGLER